MAEKRTIELEVKTNVSQSTAKVKELNKEFVTTKKEGKEVNDTLSQTGTNTSGLSGFTNGMTSLSPAIGNVTKSGQGLLKTMWAIVANPIGAIIVAIVAAITLLYKSFASTKAGADQLEQVFAGLGAVIDVIRDRILKVGNAILKFFQGDFKGAVKEGKEAISGIGAEMEKEFKQAANATKSLQKVEDAFNRLSVSRAKVNRDLAISKELLTDENASYAQKKKALEQIKITEGKQTEQELLNAKRKVAAIKLLNSLSDTSREDKKKEQDAEAALFSLQEQSARDRRAINKQEKTLLKQKTADEKEAADARKSLAAEGDARRKEAYAKDKAALEESLKAEGLNFQQRRELIILNLKLTAADRKKLNDEINKEEAKSIEAHNKVIADLNKRYDEEKENREADTAVKKEELDYKRKVAEIESVTNNELEKQTLIEKLNVEHKSRMKGIDDAAAITKAAADKVAADAEIASEQALADAKKAVQNAQLDNVIAGIGVLKGVFQENKNIQKGLLIAENAAGIAKILINTAASNAKAVAASPLTAGMPWVGINSVSAGIGIASSVAATAKGLAALGGGGSVGGGNLPTAPSGGGAPTAPNFNIVGNSGINQLAELGGQPIQAYVVSGEVTSAQALDRNRIQNATF